MASPERFQAGGSALLVVDVQGKLVDLVDRRDETVRAILTLIRAAALVDVPALATEQYPKGLGPTLPEVADLIPDRFEKTSFPCSGSARLMEALHAKGVRKVTLAGIEAHVCIAQTALALLSTGFRVQVIADAVSSRHPIDRDVALRRLELAGAVVSTAEAAIFEWTETADHPNFKAISRLIKESDLARRA